MSRVAVVVVHYRAEGLLQRCLEALRRSTFASWEVVVVDNGSDGDLAWVAADERCSLVSPGRNLGFAAGTNRGLREVGESPDFVLLLNPDVILDREALGLLVEVLDAEPRVGAVGGRLLLESGGVDPACRRAEPTPLTALAKLLGLSRLFPRSRFLARYNLGHLDSQSAGDIDSGTGACLLVRRSALNQVGGGLDERFFLYGEDLDLCRRLRQVGWRVRFEPRAEGLHLKGSGRIRPPRVTVQFYRAMWQYYRKWGRHRGNPLVLAALLALLVSLAAVEQARNESRRWWSARR